MIEDQSIESKKDIFGMIFLLGQRWQTLGDLELASIGVTTKQWLLLITLHVFFKDPPTLNQLTEAMGSSRQNVKQLASNLQRSGFLEIFQDAVDKRVLRFRLTQKNAEIWEARAQRDQEYINSLFGDASPQDILSTRSTLERLLAISFEKLRGRP
ncbi:MAG: MarR family transcriptional regulator [Candidatus Marinimicrobia bacterium]|nr:MarR family transcriptional regulator [Candidatus Neomarinimicrobiota bacterium]